MSEILTGGIPVPAAPHRASHAVCGATWTQRRAACSTQRAARTAPESQRSQSSAMVRGAKNCKRRRGSHGVRVPFLRISARIIGDQNTNKQDSSTDQHNKGTQTHDKGMHTRRSGEYRYSRALPNAGRYATIRRAGAPRRACTKKSRNSHDVRLLYANCLMYACAATRSHSRLTAEPGGRNRRVCQAERPSEYSSQYPEPADPSTPPTKPHLAPRRNMSRGVCGTAAGGGSGRLHERRERGLAADEGLQLVQQVEALLVPGGSAGALQHAATHRGTMQQAAARCNMLQQAATCCLNHSAARGGGGGGS